MESLSTDAYTELFESEVTRVLDVCAPLRTKTRRQGSHDRVPLSEEACIAKRMCRRLERRFRRSGSPSDKQLFHEARSVARDLIYRCMKHHKYVTDKRHISAVGNYILTSLIEFLTQKFSIDKNFSSALKLFHKYTNIMPEADLKSVHQVSGSDLSLETVVLE
jgi:hypothetical protein